MNQWGYKRSTEYEHCPWVLVYLAHLIGSEISGLCVRSITSPVDISLLVVCSCINMYHVLLFEHAQISTHVLYWYYNVCNWAINQNSMHTCIARL